MADEKKIITSDVLNSYGSAIKTYVDAKDNSLQSQLNGIKTTVDNIGEHTKVIDNLTSEETTKALSAKQGKILKDLVDAKYTKPSSGIPKNDLESAVQASLSKADSSVQPNSISDMETRTHATATYQPKGDYIVEGDSRLTDSRTPKDHTHSQSDITNLTTDLQNIRETAEGKTKTYVASYFTPSSDPESFPNVAFNSNEELVLINSSFIIIRKENALDQSISDDELLSLDNLKIGDVILIVETDVPDRWYGGKSGSNHMFYKMETAKIDLEPYATKTYVNNKTNNKSEIVASPLANTETYYYSETERVTFCKLRFKDLYELAENFINGKTQTVQWIPSCYSKVIDAYIGTSETHRVSIQRGHSGIITFNWSKSNDSSESFYPTNAYTSPNTIEFIDVYGKEDKSNLKALAYKDSLTASEVGARPDTWTPTADQVGAYTKTEVDNAIANAKPNITYATASDLADIWKN